MPHRHDDGEVVAYVPACRMEKPGGCQFRRGPRAPLSLHVGARWPNGIASVEIVEAMGRAGFLGAFGAAGLSPAVVEGAVDRLQRDLGDSTPFAMNLIHSPGEPELESSVVDVYLRRKVRLIEASAFLNLTLPVVRYRVAGIRRDSSGRIVVPNRIIAKISRVEVASKFMAPPPAKFLQRAGRHAGRSPPIRPNGPRRIPMAEDITAEADSGGTYGQSAGDRPLADHAGAAQSDAGPVRLRPAVADGAAGGISTPWAAAAALAMGAAYIVTGSVNQSCVEAGTSDVVRRMLCQAQQADVAMAPGGGHVRDGGESPGLEALARSSQCERPSSTSFIEPTRDWITSPRAIGTRWRRRSSGPRSRRSGIRRRSTSGSATRRESSGRSGTPSRRWPWSSAGTSGCRRNGPTAASRRGRSTIRSGAARPWPPSTTGCVDLSWNLPENRRVATVALNILYGAAVLTRARILNAQGVGIAPGVPRLSPLDEHRD